MCLLCGAARRRLTYAKRALTEWLERTCSFIIFVHGLATDRPCADEGRGTGVINLVMTVQFGAQSFDAIFDELLIKFLLKNTT